jgi:flavodoxin
MKALVAFYSFSGNTKKIAFAIKDILAKRGVEADTLELKPKIESAVFIQQAAQSFFSKEVELHGENILDLNGYDYIFLGTPVWAFAPAPALRSFIKRSAVLKDKKTSIFVTYGSGLGKERCVNKIERLLLERSNSAIGNIMISDKNIEDKEALLETFNNNIKL